MALVFFVILVGIVPASVMVLILLGFVLDSSIWRNIGRRD